MILQLEQLHLIICTVLVGPTVRYWFIAYNIYINFPIEGTLKNVREQLETE